MRIAPRASTSTILRPLGNLDRRFLFMLRDVAGGSMELIRIYDRDRAKACVEAGYCQIDKVGKKERVHLKDSGRRYLQAILRAD